MQDNRQTDEGRDVQLSIIVPVYNEEKYLAELLDSVVNQMDERVELILVNDGSKDGTIGICREYEARYDGVRVVDKENGGVCSARNAGLKIAGGGWLTFADGDDWFSEGSLRILLDIIAKTDADMLIHEPIMADKVLRFPVPAGVYRGDAMLENVIIPMMFGTLNSGGKGLNLGLWNCVFKKSPIDVHDLWFDEYIRMGEDLVFISQYMGICGSIELVEAQLYHWRVNEASVTHTFVPSDWWLGVQKGIYIIDRMAESLARWPRERWAKYLWPKYAHVAISAARGLVTQDFPPKEKRAKMRRALAEPVIAEAIASIDASALCSRREKVEMALLKSGSVGAVLTYCRALLIAKKLKIALGNR